MNKEAVVCILSPFFSAWQKKKKDHTAVRKVNTMAGLIQQLLSHGEPNDQGTA